ncbi:hypothetical protein OD350_24835 [Clostridium beijerinckii]|uniref:Uncharacterized protein n=1 Tax=Clostridium beijerinckii TaxID=1520 RepID=A0AAX0B483_CLOBE|nr:hypothetical protein [Clostridium beijerinckii]NRT32632.1 hypothetical protein [Clostridium beijerinckii]NRT47940.1 hypothetical protein [Clostridium beijerinckii]NRT88545.1 hypothetical protein [Clostridium beijerinckii]NRT90197.1 hypothetical protein [Clostridium beijerinckii]NRZ23764.1 hypothetical protein [Clostridium beijerinckii]
MDKVTKWIGVINLLLWTCLLISIISLNLDNNTLKEFAAGATLVVIIGIGFDLLSDRKERIKKEALVKRIYDFIGKEKQGE